MRLWLYIAQSVAAVIVLCGTLASIPAFAQLPPTTLDVTAGRSSSELVTAADGGILDLITYGGTASYSMKVTNTGTSQAFMVKLTGTAPTGPLVFDGGLIQPITAITPAAACTLDGGTSFTCNFGNIPDGRLIDGGFLASASVNSSFTISLALPPAPRGTTCKLADGGMLEGNSFGDITLTASSANADTVMKTFQNTTQTRALADVAVSIIGPTDAKEGDTVTYGVHGVNNGPCAANRVRLTNTNSLLTFQSNTAGPCPSGYPCTIANSWPAGASFDVTSTYTINKLPDSVNDTGGVQNQVDLNSTSTPNPDGGPPLLFATPDPVTTNNTALTVTFVPHGGGCNSVAGSTLGLFGIALIVLTVMRHRRRNP